MKTFAKEYAIEIDSWRTDCREPVCWILGLVDRDRAVAKAVSIYIGVPPNVRLRLNGHIPIIGLTDNPITTPGGVNS